MSSIFKIIWSDPAREDLADIIADFEKRRTAKAISSFVFELREVEQLIIQHPFMFQKKAKGSSERRALIEGSHIAMTYQVIEYRIEIISLYDTRQDMK